MSIPPPAAEAADSPMPGVAEIAALLTRRGTKVTAPRRAVAAAVAGQQRPFTSEQLVEACPGVGRATVYRTLDLLHDVGVVTRIAGADGRGRYVLGTPGHWHHLVCLGCGETVPFSACPVSSLVPELTRTTSFQIEGHLLEIFGRCPGCQQSRS
ncbi:MAG: Fur family transcriptional regulator [Chloroflexota bacterium]